MMNRSPNEPEASPSTEPEPTEEEESVCFPGSARVYLPGGDSIVMRKLEGGTEVLHDENGGSSRIFLFSHRSDNVEREFCRIETENRHVVTLSQSHYLHANGVLISADSVGVGDLVRTMLGKSRMKSVRFVRETELYAPHSMHGDLVMGGVVMSRFSRAVHPKVADMLLMPVKWLARMGLREPLGGLLYKGGRGLEKVLRGRNRIEKAYYH